VSPRLDTLRYDATVARDTQWARDAITILGVPLAELVHKDREHPRRIIMKNGCYRGGPRDLLI